MTKVTEATNGYGKHKNQSKDVFRLTLPWLQSVHIISLEEIRPIWRDPVLTRGHGGEQMAHTSETVCVCLPKPLWAAAPSLHQGIYSSQPKQHDGCTKNEMFSGSPGIWTFTIYGKYWNIFQYFCTQGIFLVVFICILHFCRTIHWLQLLFIFYNHSKVWGQIF